MLMFNTFYCSFFLREMFKTNDVKVVIQRTNTSFKNNSLFSTYTIFLNNNNFLLLLIDKKFFHSFFFFIATTTISKQWFLTMAKLSVIDMIKCDEKTIKTRLVAMIFGTKLTFHRLLSF